MTLFSEPTPLPRRSLTLRVEDPALHDFLTALLRHWRVDPRPGGERGLELRLAPGEDRLVFALDGEEIEQLALPAPLEEVWLALQRQLFNPPRRHYRIPLRLRAQLHQRGEGEPFLSVSLSDAGIRFEFYRELVRDEEVEIVLPLPEGPLRLVGKVIYCIPTRASGKMIVGVMFLGMDHATAERLRTFLATSTLQMVRPQLERAAFHRALAFLDLPAALRAEFDR